VALRLLLARVGELPGGEALKAEAEALGHQVGDGTYEPGRRTASAGSAARVLAKGWCRRSGLGPSFTVAKRCQ